MNDENEKRVDPAQSADEEEIQLAAQKFCSDIIAKNGTLDVQKGWRVRRKSYMCDICCKILFKRRSWLRHMEIHEKKKKYSCTHCERKFGNEEMLETHLQMHEEQFADGAISGNGLESSMTSVDETVNGELAIEREVPRTSESELVEKSVSEITNTITEGVEKGEMERMETLVESDTSEVGKTRQYECRFCGKCFAKNVILQIHIKNWHKNRTKTFKCKICFKELSAPHSLRYHMSAKHGMEIEIGKERKFQCKHCPKKFTCHARLKIHCESELHLPTPDETVDSSGMSGFQETKTDTKMNESSTIEDRKMEDCLVPVKNEEIRRSETFTCKICGKRFAMLQSLRYHLLRRHKSNKEVGKVRRLMCKYCMKKFKSVARLRMHSEIHNGRYVCYVCDQVFADGATLQMHVKAHGKKTVDCPYCGITFASKTELNYHIKSTGENLFICSICFETFENYLAFKYHISVHNKEEVFICTLCDKKFVTDCELAEHIREHC